MSDLEIRKLALAEFDAVFRMACHLARSPQAAEDLVQETYLRAFRYSSTFTLGEQGIRPWLFKILHNVLSNSAARRQREQLALHRLQQMTPAEPQETAAPMVDCSTLDWDWVDERLKQAIAELPLAYRVVFLLSAAEGLKYQEIADVTEVPIGTVMSRLSRARSALAARLIELGLQSGESRLASEAEFQDEDGSVRPENVTESPS